LIGFIIFDNFSGGVIYGMNNIIKFILNEKYFFVLSIIIWDIGIRLFLLFKFFSQFISINLFFKFYFFKKFFNSIKNNNIFNIIPRKEI
jgi:hypothetical protein